MTSMQQIALNPKMFSYESYNWNLIIEKSPSYYLFMGQYQLKVLFSITEYLHGLSPCPYHTHTI